MKEDEKREAVQCNLSNLRKKVADLRERHTEGKVEFDLYQELKQKYEQEISDLMKAYTVEGFEKSNLEKFISHALDFCQNLRQSWTSGDYDVKQRLQQLVFP